MHSHSNHFVAAQQISGQAVDGARLVLAQRESLRAEPHFFSLLVRQARNKRRNLPAAFHESGRGPYLVNVIADQAGCKA